MSLRAQPALVAALLLLAPTASQAALSPYTQNFEALVQTDLDALKNDGWLVYGNVYTPAHLFLYGYGAFPAPNPGGGFCAIDAGQGGTEQGAQQLSVYSDYNNLDHAAGSLIEANVFQERTIVAGDVGNTWTFQFDAKLGNLTGATTALAFIKTLDPNNGYATTNFRTVNTTSIPSTWGTYSITLPIISGLIGQLLQFGFANTATQYEGSGVFYDNLFWFGAATDVTDTPRANSLELRAAAPNPFMHSTRIEYSLAQRGRAEIGVFDIVGRRVATLFHGLAEPGSHAVTWDGRTADGRLAPTGVYQCVLKTATGGQARSIVLSR